MTMFKSFCLIAGLLLLSAQAEAGAELGQAEQMLRSGRGGQAYELLLPYQFAQSGDPEFDYLFGLAALEAGHPGIATLAFERVLAVAPNHGAARIDMGRAYFALGDLSRARREFELARALNPPPAVQAVLARYLAQMQARENSPANKISAYAEAGFGTDSNVTQGPAAGSLFLPAFGVNFQLNAASQKIRDNFSQYNAGAEISHRLDDGPVLYAGVDARWRNYGEVRDFNYASSDWHGGVEWNEGRNTWRLAAGYNDYRLDRQRYRSISSLGGELRQATSEREQLNYFVQYARVRYAQDTQANNDINQWAAGAGWLVRLDYPWPTLLSVAAYAGNETEADRQRPRVDGDKNLIGVRGGVQVSPQAEVDVFLTAGAQIGKYGRTNVLYDRQRSDALYEIAAGSVWRFAPQWSLKPQISWLNNNSNLSINAYQRYEISIFLRRDFQ